jgi:hypothetical protein
MDPESTELIGLGPRSHLRALERLWLLYLRSTSIS